MSKTILSFVAVILTGGDPVPAHLATALPSSDLVIAADSGFHHAQTLGLEVDIVIGDFDSIDLDVDLGNAQLARYPADKDFSDLELALRHAAGRGATDLVVVGGGGGRLDHLLANVLVLAKAPAQVVWLTGKEVVHFVRNNKNLLGRRGDLLTLLPVCGDATGITTSGLRWELEEATLRFGSTRGLSNEFLDTVAQVSIRSGLVLAIHTTPFPTFGHTTSSPTLS